MIGLNDRIPEMLAAKVIHTHAHTHARACKALEALRLVFITFLQIFI